MAMATSTSSWWLQVSGYLRSCLCLFCCGMSDSGQWTLAVKFCSDEVKLDFPLIESQVDSAMHQNDALIRQSKLLRLTARTTDSTLSVQYSLPG